MKKVSATSEPLSLGHSYSKYLEEHAYIVMPLLLILADYLGVVCASYAATALRNAWVGNNELQVSWLNMYVVFPLIFIAFFHVAQLYQRRMQFWLIIEKLFYGCSYANLTIILLLYLTKIAATTSRLYVFLFWGLSFFMTVFCRYVVKRVLGYTGLMQLPVLMLGGGKTAGLLLHAFTGDIGLGYRVIGVLDDFGADRTAIGDLPCLGTFADAERVIQETKVQNVFIAAPGMDPQKLGELIYRVQPLVRNISFVPDLIGIPVGSLEVESMFNEKLMLLRMRNHLARRYNRVCKFIFDLVLTSVGTVCISPLLLLLYLVIKLDSPGPVIFAHQRVGRGGKLFPCYKFRTMCVDADVKLRELLAHDAEARKEWQAEFKLKNDPRVTRIGRFLRKTSLDELPQIFNVLKGEMSLVGPRPIVPDEIKKYGNYINDFYMVPPGITGMWQVNGRSDTTYAERVQMDSWYVRNWSVWLDVVLLFRTFKAVIAGKGAY